MFLLTAQNSRQLDAISESLGVSVQTLMQNAGRAVAEELMKRTRPGEGPVVFFLGKGNNGGDGRAAARILEEKKYSVTWIPFESELKKFSTEIQKAAWLVDALLGVGLKGPPQGWIAQAIETINRSGRKVLSIDTPSGLSADKGIPLGTAVKADVTVCLAGVKLGCFVHPGVDFAGEVVRADIGIPREAYQKIQFDFRTTEPDDFRTFLKKRPRGAHKGDFGHVLVVAGSKGMPGAGFLAGLSALRSGCGRVTWCLPEGAYEKFDPRFAEVMVQAVSDDGLGIFVPDSAPAVLQKCKGKSAVVLGPGLGRDSKTTRFVCEVISKIPLPLVLDADGLFAVSDAPRVLKDRKAPTLMTPHLGEMARLLGWQTEEVEKGKIQVSLDAARAWNSILILKGFRSLIALPEGRLFVNPTGNPGMATAGMGDVLAGVLGGLLAQGFSAQAAALAGVYLHGLAGDLSARAQGERGLIASDVAAVLPKAMQQVSASL